MAQRTLIKGGTVISVDPEVGDFETGDVLIENGVIAAVGASLEAGDAQVIDATDRIVMPGLIDTHRHTWQALFRNIGSDWTLAHYFTGLHGTMSQLYRPEDTYAGNLIGTLEALDGGITTLLDWSHNLNTPEHSDAAIEALQETRSRVIFGHGCGFAHWAPVSSLPHDEDIRRVAQQYFSSDDQLVTLAMAPRGNQFATLDVTEHDYRLAQELDIRITCHAGDGEWGKGRPIAQLHERGLLDSTQTYVHCNSLADDELKMMADAGCTASISPDIELQMGHGWPATGRLLDAGMRPSLSIDVCCSNGGHLFGTIRATIGTQRGFDQAAAGGALRELELTCRDVLEFATIEGARAVGMDTKIGSLTPGKRADLILIRTDNFGMTPLNNPVGAVVYNAHPGLVDTVLVDGEVVKRDGTLVGVDVARVRRLAVESRDDILRRANGANGARLGGDWIPKPYEAVEA
ncbi:MAG: 5-methylthioadenosine/S-adenosylhomocysteine deaminase [Gaiellales bacterium]|jgi:cytosine/adenosine deaminase-related metal-dependent hydrolase|nr:5-methylthioadenosine/S-adenosylhomocysteine deaminase [Gaiellales bacterium]